MQSPRISLSVKVIVRDPKGHALLLRRSASSKGNPGRWEFPGGKIDPGEAFDEALRREVREETGLEIDLAGTFDACESNLGDRRIVYLIMEGTAQGANVVLSSEHDAHRWVAPSDFGDMDFSPQFRRAAQRYAQDAAANPRVPVPKTPDDPDVFKGFVPRPDELGRQLDEFKTEHPKYKALSAFLEKYLAENLKAIVPAAIVGARPKDPFSFAGKLIKKKKYTDPLVQMTDLVGARVIVHLQSEVEAVCQWIEATFEIDPANSMDKLKELGPDKFGYRSVHYVVVLRGNKPDGAGLPPALAGLKAELQVRTIAQHAWSDIGHDRLYKTDCEIPTYWKRESNRISALLEAADSAFARLVQGVAAYQAHFRYNADAKELQRNRQLWESVRQNLPSDPRAAQHAARLALEAEDWAAAISAVDQFKGPENSDLLCAKGYALCRSAGHAETAEWKLGIKLLEKAANEFGARVDPLLRLGELHSERELNAALRHFSRAFALDASNPQALAGYIRCQVLKTENTKIIPPLRPAILEAIRRSEDLAAAQADLPHAYYRMAGFLMLLGEENSSRSLEILARAVHETRADTLDPLIQALKDVSALADCDPQRADIECARRFLAAALIARQPKAKWPDRVKKPAAKALDAGPRVIIVAGGCDAAHQDLMLGYQKLLRAALGNFEGVIISGGTREGISGLVGQIAKESNGRIRAIGYLPENLPTDKSATMDERYSLRRTDSTNRFTAREPIQSWLDLLEAGVRPQQVRLLGINGGNIAGLEYRIAVALGATVGVIEGSEREAGRVAEDWPAQPRSESSDASAAGKLLVLPPDPMTVRAFLELGIASPDPMTGEAVQVAARLAHCDFLEEQRYKNPDPVMQPWHRLRADLQESNISQIAYLVPILRAGGFGVRKFEGIPNDPRFTGAEVEELGEMEHGRWNAERLASGWKFGPAKDTAKKISPYLVPWDRLPPAIRKYDLQNVIAWPRILAEVGYEIFRLTEK